MKVTFIVNGTETIVTARRDAILSNVAKTALEQVGMTGRHYTEFQVILDNETLSFNAKLNNQFVKDKQGKITNEEIILNENDVIFLSLKAGKGASN